ncbi:hypothetical protein [Nocardioides luteus]|uniref:hypothetical protein n=1 Tax=Nocardioides luteus TaxID=1844 RepID=UPI0018C9E9EA|nr:hypothetical protein [Nocardioides luteus]MBG6099062.1 hypothetical protein [Nocardioides luteus]
MELERPLSIRNHRTLTISRKGRARRDVVGNGLRAEGRRYLGLDVLAKSQTIGQPAEEVIPPEPQALTALP